MAEFRAAGLLRQGKEVRLAVNTQRSKASTGQGTEEVESAHSELDASNGLVIIGHHLVKRYGVGEAEVWALNGVSIEVARGEMVAIMGSSGSGKSTLMNILGCLDRPTSGDYLLDGQKVSDLKDDDLAAIRNRKIGFVFQSFNLLPRLTAFENVALPARYSGVPRAEREERAKRELERVGLGGRVSHRPSQLSGGQQQRVAIARALINDPAVILADEPTGNLDSKSGDEIMEILKALNIERKTTIVIVTHDAHIASYTHRTIRLRDGVVVED